MSRMARFLGFVLVLFGLAAYLGCGSSGGGSGRSSNSVKRVSVSVPVTSDVPLTLTANVPATKSIYVNLPGDFDWGRLASATLDLNATVSNLSVVRMDGGVTPSPTVNFSLRVAQGNDAGGSCGGGVEAASAAVTGDATFATKSVVPSTKAFSQAALDIINTGDFTVCTSATSSVDASMNFGPLATSFGFDSTCSAANELAGRWVGTYSCDNQCGGTPSTEAGTVEITITQSGRTAIYWDEGGAVYIGSVCGSSFRHLGVGAGYVEYGTFTRTGATTATKTSTWVGTGGGGCSGTCSDTLTLSTP